jgi:hypothetical protein
MASILATDMDDTYRETRLLTMPCNVGPFEIFSCSTSTAFWAATYI